MGDVGLHVHTQRTQVIGHQLGGVELAVPQFGILMNLVPHLDDRRGKLFDGFVDRAVLRLEGNGHGQGHRTQGQDE